jgi:hydrogenase maturation protease
MRHILCFGNPLHGDDGFGYAVYQKLTEQPLLGGVRAFDAGTPGLNALPLFQGCSEVIIVDAMAPFGRPGRLCTLSTEMLDSERTLIGHDVGIGFLLQALAALPEEMPKIHIIGVEAEAVNAFRPGLSEAVAGMVDTVVTLLKTQFTDEYT